MINAAKITLSILALVLFIALCFSIGMYHDCGCGFLCDCNPCECKAK